MKKIVLACFFLLFLPFSEKVNAQDNLQMLIQKASPNSELLLEAKEYTGPFTIDKPLKIIGTKGTKITSDTVGFYIQNTSNVILESMEIKTKEAPIVAENIQNLQVNKMDIYLEQQGLIFKKINQLIGKDLVVQGISEGHFSQKPSGIEIYESDHITLTNNSIKNVQDGMYLELTDSVKIDNCSVQEGRYGLHFMYGDDILLANNHVHNNVTGFMLMVIEGLTVENNIMEKHLRLNSSGMYLYDVENAVINQNNFLENTIATVWNNVSETSFQHNVFQANSSVIESERSSSVLVSNNQFVGNILVARSDTQGFQLAENSYDDYNGYDFDKNGFGDTPHYTYTSFGQWMVRKPVYQYFIEAPSVTLLNTMDSKIQSETDSLLVDHTPRMASTTFNWKLKLDFIEMALGLLGTIVIIYCWRKLI